MSKRKFKLGFRPAVWLSSPDENPFEIQLALTQEAESLGFDAVFFGDRMLSEVGDATSTIYGSTHTEVFTTLTAMAARTTKIQLGTLVLVLPYRHPVQVAKITASLDLFSNGRLILPVGAGWNQTEFKVLGITQKEAAGRMEESMEILRELWTGKSVTYNGRYYQFEGAQVEPKPAQVGGPPLWLGSFSPSQYEIGVTGISPRVEKILARVGRMADGWAPLVYSTKIKRGIDPAVLGDAWRKVQQYAAEAGRPGKVQFVFSHWYYAIESAEDEAAARRDLAIFFPGTFEEAKETYLIGSVAEIAAKVKRMTSHIDKIDWFVFTQLGCNQRQLQLLYNGVMPLLEG